MSDTENKPPQNTPPTNNPPANNPSNTPPPDNAQYVTLARPQAHAVFSEQRVEFKDDEVKMVVKSREPGDDPNKTILAKTAKELLDAGRIVHCTKNGKPLEADKPAKENDK